MVYEIHSSACFYLWFLLSEENLWWTIAFTSWVVMSKNLTYCIFNWGSGVLTRPGNSPSPCGCDAWFPAAPWPSGSDCAPCRRPGSQSRCPHHRWAEESVAWLWIQKQMVSGQGCKLTTRQTDKYRNRQTGRSRQTQVGRTAERQRQTDNWAQRERERERESEREGGRELKVECRLKLDKNPHRSTPLIGVPPPSVTLINLKESDSLSFWIPFIFPSAFCWQVASPALMEISLCLTAGSSGARPEGPVLGSSLYSHAGLTPRTAASRRNNNVPDSQTGRDLIISPHRQKQEARVNG